MIERNARFVYKNAIPISIAAIMLTLLSLYVVITKFSIKSDFADLLPEGQRSVVDQRIIRERVGSPEYIQVLLETVEKNGDRIVIKSNELKGDFTTKLGQLSMKFIVRGYRVVFSVSDEIPEKWLNSKIIFSLEREMAESPYFSFEGVIRKIDGAVKSYSIEPVVPYPDFYLAWLFRNVNEGDPNGDEFFVMEGLKSGMGKIADALEKSPLVSDVFYRLDTGFLDKNKLLFAKVEDLKRLKCCIKEKQREAIEKEFSVGAGEGDWAGAEEDDDPFAKDEEKKDIECEALKIEKDKCFSEDEVKGKYERKIRRVPDFLISDLGYLTFLVRPVKPSIDIEFTRKVLNEVRDTVIKVLDENSDTLGRYVLKEEINFGGGFPQRLHEIKRIEHDIFSSTTFTVSLLLIVLLAYFRKIRALPLVLIPLVAGILWTLAITFLTIGSLNLITAFIVAILFGLGIDYGIHMLSRYIEERRRGKGILEAIIVMQKRIGTATISSALTTIATFYALMFTHFKGLSQFGAIAGTGVLFCLIIIFTAFPALLVVTERIYPMKLKSLIEDENVSATKPLRRGLIASVILSVVYLVLFAYGALKIDELQFEYDFRKLGSDNPELKEFHAKREGSLRGLTISPTVALANNPEQGKMLAKDLKEKKLESVELVSSIFDIIPDDQQEKLTIIREIRKLIDKKRDFVESEEDKKRVDDLYRYTEVDEITLDNVPEEYQRFFREEKGGSPGNVVYIFPSKDLQDGHNCLEFHRELGDYTLNGEQLPISGSALVLADVLKMIQIDGPHAIGIAFFTVFFIVIMKFAITLGGRAELILLNHLFFLLLGLIFAKYRIFFGSLWEALFIMTGVSLATDIIIDWKNLSRTLLVLTPVLSGLMLTVGAMYLLDLRINLFNMVVLPTMIGIGIDNGLHLYLRYREEGVGSIAFVLKHTGPPIFMASLTTTIGFTGVLMTTHKGLQSLGNLAILTMSLCFLTSITFFPAILRVLEWLKVRI